MGFRLTLSAEAMPEEYSDDDIIVDEEVEVERRYAWQVTSWILMSLTLVLNLAVIFVLLYRQNAYNVVNKGESTVHLHNITVLCSKIREKSAILGSRVVCLKG